MAEKIGKVNWVICPKCQWRYYVGAPLLLETGIPAICPKCRTEFEASENLEAKLKAKAIADRFY